MENNNIYVRKARTYTLPDDVIIMLGELMTQKNERTLSGTLERLIRDAHAIYKLGNSTKESTIPPIVGVSNNHNDSASWGNPKVAQSDRMRPDVVQYCEEKYP